MKLNKKSPRPVLHQRPGSHKPPPQIAELLLDAAFCQRIALAFPQYETLFNKCLLHLTADPADAGHIVVAIGKIYALARVFKEQGDSDIEYYKTPTE